MTDHRSTVRSGLASLFARPHLASDVMVRNAVWDVGAPVEQVKGREAIVAEVVEPIRRALSDVRRRDEIVIGGENRRDYGGRWVACVTHLVGTHVAPLWGVAPSGRLAMLRAGEFHQIASDGRIVESRIIFDLPDLMRQAGRQPFPVSLGTELTWPGPATHDGICPREGNGKESLDLVERMLSRLHVYDVKTRNSAGQTGEGGVWADDMLWWGPGGIGSNYRWKGFVRDHRDAFLEAFPDRKGGNHYCRIGDGNYAAISGWPSMTMTHKGSYLGMEPTDKALTLRVMDFYRIAEGKLAENWVMLDYVDLFRQMGRDILS
jgi:predicted ester cyclase